MLCSSERLLQVVALLSEVVAIGLTPQAVEQAGQWQWRWPAELSMLLGAACVAKAAWAGSRVHCIIGVK